LPDVVIGQADPVGYVVFGVGAAAAMGMLIVWVYQRVARRRVKGGRRY
jgi:hypothetical protein